MYLRQLELAGFKSFAKRTILDFPKGVTVIVGPNGSGKSNVVDAIRWVLAEQSFKNLRSKKGEDLIFHGSSSRRSLSRSSVSINFSDVAPSDPLGLEEVAIERRIIKNGTNQYLLNGKIVRLVDLETYLNSSSIGAGSFRILSQGMSDMLITLGPQEFRSFIEEAAGVKEYQDKKHRSLTKINLSEQNLEKVSALIAELAPRVNFLKREHKKFEKRHETEERLKNIAKELFGFRYHRLLSSEQVITKKKKSLQERVSSLNTATAKLREDLFSQEEKKEQDGALGNILENLHNLEDKDHETSIKIITLEGKIKLEEERARAVLPITKDYLKDSLTNVLDSGEELLEKQDNIKESFSLILSKIKNLIKEIREGRKESSDNSSLLGNIKQELIGSIKERERLRSEIKELALKRDETQKKMFLERSDFLKKEKIYRQKEEELHVLKTNLSDTQLEEEKINLRREQLSHDLKNLDIVTLAELIDLSPGAIEEEEKEEELWRLKKKMDQIGTIDLAITEEYEGVQERHEFLLKESEDLGATIDSLKKLVNNLDHQIEGLFKGALGKVSKSFNNHFRLMFGGGKASLLHTLKSPKTSSIQDEDIGAGEHSEEEDSPIKGGVEIRVELPGKKIKSLTNLSGGERTLISIALLFSLVNLRKPPFLVLDEIDAALDEVNSGRFIRLLNELAKSTQFIIITHNRETMRGADAIYGVSIKEGVSQLLSIKLEKDETVASLTSF